MPFPLGRAFHCNSSCTAHWQCVLRDLHYKPLYVCFWFVKAEPEGKEVNPLPWRRMPAPWSWPITILRAIQVQAVLISMRPKSWCRRRDHGHQDARPPDRHCRCLLFLRWQWAAIALFLFKQVPVRFTESSTADDLDTDRSDHFTVQHLSATSDYLSLCWCMRPSPIVLFFLFCTWLSTALV